MASSTNRLPRCRVMWSTSEIPSTTPRQVTSQGSAPSACMAQLARRESAERALFACTVVSEQLSTMCVHRRNSMKYSEL